MHMQAGAKPGIMPSTGRAWLSVAILLLIAIFSYLDRLIVSLLVEPIRLSLHATDFQMGLLQGIAFGLFYALFGIPIGWLVDRYSRRGIIYVGMTLWSFAAAMCGMAQTYGHLLIARFGVGVGEASLSPAAYSIISDLFPPRRLALALGVFATGAALGGALAYIVGGAVIQYFENIGTIAFPVVGQLEPWQMVFVVTGLPGIFVAMLVFFVPEPVRRQSPVLAPGADAGVIPFLLANRRYFICHFLAFGLIAVVAYGTAAWMPAMLMRRYGMGPAEVGILLGLVNIGAGIPGFILPGWIVDRWFAAGTRDAHLRYFVFATLLAAALAVVAFQIADSLWLLVPALAGIHFLHPFTGPSVAHLQLATPNRFRGRVSALFVLIFNLMGMCLGPPSVAFLTDFVFHDPMRVNTSIMMVSVVALCLSSVLLMIGLAPARRIVQATEIAA
ncbi:putative MFS family arabinose efflux permease [Sphingobium wenxiniae]|uniref:Putative MFS family arabinose efflux permease n=2 Tax=Sphingomonadaceae TaxID=41297 RepID=A0A562KGL5_SPHWJ|nr:putative MFS family arabinose efflux permease [Sphingobium wenxiniae]